MHSALRSCRTSEKKLMEWHVTHSNHVDILFCLVMGFLVGTTILTDRPCNSASRTFANISIISTSVCNHAIGRLIILDTTYNAIKAAEPLITMTVYCPLPICYATPPSIFPLEYTLYQENWHCMKKIKKAHLWEIWNRYNLWSDGQ